MTTISRPPSGIARRFMNASPASYDAKARTVETVISSGSPVNRFYGTEELEISRAAVDLSRLGSVGVPVLDSHQQIGISNSIGKLSSAWIEKGSLIGQIKFHATPEGRKAEGMISRGEIGGVSAGYTVSRWEISDEDGTVLDPDKDKIRWDDELTYTATRWMLHEVSLVSVPADATASIRSLSGNRASRVVQNMRIKVQMRQREIEMLCRRMDYSLNRLARKHGWDWDGS